MALNTYDELKTAVENWLERDNLGTRVEDFISIAEKKINRKLRVREMEEVTTLSTVAGTDTVTLPDRFKQARGLSRVDGAFSVRLDSITPTQGVKLGRCPSGTPTHYSIVGSNIHFYPTPDDIYTINFTYYAGSEPLSESVSTSTLVPDYSDILLYMSVAQGKAFLFDEQTAAIWYAAAEDMIQEANTDAKRGRVGAAPSMVMAGQNIA